VRWGSPARRAPPGDVSTRVCPHGAQDPCASTPPQIKGIKAYMIPERQRLTVPGAAGAKPTVLVRGKTLAELGVKVRIASHENPHPG
jgi:hypothetical protein